MIKIPVFLHLIMICCIGTQGADGMQDTQHLDEWKAFYRKHFNMELDIRGIQVPSHQDGFDRILVVAEGLTHEAVIEVMQTHFEMICVNVYLNSFYDQHILSVRSSRETYAVRVRNTSVSGEYRKMSNCVEKTDPGYKEPLINDITLLERLILELKYFDETGQHLDVEEFTVCGGSFFSKDPQVLSPAVGWKTGTGAYYPPFLFISECFKAFTLDGLYSRHVITTDDVEPETKDIVESTLWYSFPYNRDRRL